MAEITQIDLGLVVGDTGATGATGPTGPQGPGATISVGSVTTTTYGNPAQVTNSGTATDAVLDFVIPQGAPGEEVTDVSSLTLNSITETAASFPVPAVGDVMSVVMGKVKKFFADTVAALNTKLNKSNVVNDLTYTTEGYALDARAGKTLKTQIDSLNDSLAVTSKQISDGTYGTFRAYRYGRVLTYQWHGVGTAPTTEPYQLPETLPTALQPIYNISAPMRLGDNTMGYFTVDTGGVVSIFANKKSWSSGNASVIAKS